MSDDFAIDVRFYRLSEEVQPYFTALYSFTIDCDADVMVRDQLHPEWSAMRFTQYGTAPFASITPDEIAPRAELTAPPVQPAPAAEGLEAAW